MSKNNLNLTDLICESLKQTRRVKDELNVRYGIAKRTSRRYSRSVRSRPETDTVL